MADVGVDCVCEIDRSSAARKHDYASERSKRVDFLGVQVHLQGGHELAGIAHLALPFDQLPQPCDPLIIGSETALPFLVLPMRRDAFFGDAVHLLGANLDFEAVPSGPSPRYEATDTDSDEGWR